MYLVINRGGGLKSGREAIVIRDGKISHLIRSLIELGQVSILKRGEVPTALWLVYLGVCDRLHFNIFQFYSC